MKNNCIRNLVFYAVILLITLCCKNQISEVQYNYWHNNNIETTFVTPRYKDGFYYIFPVDYNHQIISCVKISELNGSIEYIKEIGVFTNEPNMYSSNVAFIDDFIYLIYNNVIAKINIESGAVVEEVKFENFIWRAEFYSEVIAICQYATDLKSMSYSTIDIYNLSSQELLIKCVQEDNHDLCGGHSPIKINEEWIIPFFTGNKTDDFFSNTLYKIDNKGINDSLVLDLTEDIITGPIILEGLQAYIVSLNKLYSLDLHNFKIDWSSEFDKTISGGIILSGDKILLSPKTSAMPHYSYEVDIKNGRFQINIDENQHLNYITINDYVVILQSDGYSIRQKDSNILYKKINALKSKPYSLFGLSPNTILVRDINGWHCIPI